MDTSKEYILMCEKAEEIQKSDFNDDDFYLDDDICIGEKLFDIIDYDSEDVIWLPRQDQLQEIVKDPLGFRGVLARFIFWLDGVKNKDLNSMEQLWLAFVMKELYQKHWSEKEWLK